MPQVTIENPESFPEELRSHFKEADGVHSFSFVTEAEVVGLKSKRDELLKETKAAKERLSSFDGIEDPKAALEALNKVKTFDQKKMVDAGKLDELKAQITEGFTAKLAERDKTIAERDAALNQEMIGGRFARSSFIADNLAIPADMVEATFGAHFSIEDGRVVAKDKNGNVITSTDNFTEPAGFDEALAKIVDAYPHKDKILKSKVKEGSGMTQGVTGKSKTISRSQFDALSAAAKMKYIKDGGEVTD